MANVLKTEFVDEMFEKETEYLLIILGITFHFSKDK